MVIITDIMFRYCDTSVHKFAVWLFINFRYSDSVIKMYES